MNQDRIPSGVSFESFVAGTRVSVKYAGYDLDGAYLADVNISTKRDAGFAFRFGLKKVRLSEFLRNTEKGIRTAAAVRQVVFYGRSLDY